MLLLPTIIATFTLVFSKADANVDRDRIFQVVHEECLKYDRPFTVLDLGAGDGTISMALAQEFPDSVFVMLERNIGLDQKKASTLLEHLEEEESPSNLVLLNKSINVKEIETLSKTEHFDIILAFDFLQRIHLPKMFTPRALLNFTIHLGDTLFASLPMKSKSYIKVFDHNEYLNDSETLPFETHQFYTFKNEDTPYLRHHWYDEESSLMRIAASYEDNALYLTFDIPPFQKRLYRPPGISLITFQNLRGAFPTSENLMHLTENLQPPLHPKQILVQGNAITLLPTNSFQDGTGHYMTYTEDIIDCKTKAELKEKLK